MTIVKLASANTAILGAKPSVRPAGTRVSSRVPALAAFPAVAALVMATVLLATYLALLSSSFTACGPLGSWLPAVIAAIALVIELINAKNAATGGLWFSL